MFLQLLIVLRGLRTTVEDRKYVEGLNKYFRTNCRESGLAAGDTIENSVRYVHEWQVYVQHDGSHTCITFQSTPVL